MMFASSSFVPALAAVIRASPLQVRQADSDSSVGRPISVGIAANRSAPAFETFGTTNQSSNFLNMPTTLCVVPMYAREAGIKNSTDLLITQQALDICPRAQLIAVSEINSTATTA